LKVSAWWIKEGSWIWSKSCCVGASDCEVRKR